VWCRRLQDLLVIKGISKSTRKSLKYNFSSLFFYLFVVLVLTVVLCHGLFQWHELLTESDSEKPVTKVDILFSYSMYNLDEIYFEVAES